MKECLAFRRLANSKESTANPDVSGSSGSWKVLQLFIPHRFTRGTTAVAVAFYIIREGNKRKAGVLQALEELAVGFEGKVHFSQYIVRKRRRNSSFRLYPITSNFSCMCFQLNTSVPSERFCSVSPA